MCVIKYKLQFKEWVSFLINGMYNTEKNDSAKGKINDRFATNPPHSIRPYIHMHVEWNRFLRANRLTVCVFPRTVSNAPPRRCTRHAAELIANRVFPFINPRRMFNGGELNFSKLTAYKTAFGRGTIPYKALPRHRRKGRTKVNLSTVRSPGINNVINRRSVKALSATVAAKVQRSGGREGEKVFNFVGEKIISFHIPSHCRAHTDV